MIYKCKHCGHIFDEDMEGKKISEFEHCPVCENPIEDFEKVKSEDFQPIDDYELIEDKGDYKVYRCKHCGHIFDEKMEGKKLEELEHCPICENPIEDFEIVKYKPSKVDEYELIEDKGDYKVYRCKHCGHIFDEEMEGKKLEELSECPVCKNPIEDFELIETKNLKRVNMDEYKLVEDRGEFKVYRCTHCGHVFDEEMEGKKLEELSECPVCKNPIEDFELVETTDDYELIEDNEDYKVYRCKHCGHIFDEREEGKKLEEIDYCPVCKNPIEDFELIDIHDYELIEDNEDYKVYRCKNCGHIFDERKENCKLEELSECPTCKQDIQDFVVIDKKESKSGPKSKLAYPKKLALSDENNRGMDTIHKISTTGKSIDSSMATEFELPSWDDILILANQLDPMPLDYDDEVSTKTIIGKNAEKPLEIESPVYISHMSFGALSRDVKIALSKGSAKVKTAICSGEGGILPEEMESAYKYIFEYVPNKYSVNDENLKNADAIEIKIGQGTKPGLGGHLPGEKVTGEIAELRDMPVGQDIQSPSKFEEINSKEDLKKVVENLREKSEGRPIGVKIAPGKLERDLEFILFAKPDFITIDGRGGGTASSPQIIKDSTSIPTIYALNRARKFLDEHNSDIDLVITGGLRLSADFAKALAMGADAIAIATAALMSCACQQYKQCHIGQCPMGVTTQEKDLRERFEDDKAVERLENYLTVSLNELKNFAKVTGHKNVHDLNIEDLGTFKREISEFTDINHV